MKLIFATDLNFAIGLEGEMLFYIPDDLARFRQFTEGNIVIMGRKTLESLPGSAPLPNRTNLVVTSSQDPLPEGAVQVKSLDDLDIILKEHNPTGEKEVFVIGGGALVADLLDQVDEAFITMYHKDYKKADTWIPNLDADAAWCLASESKPHPFEDSYYTYRVYKRMDKVNGIR